MKGIFKIILSFILLISTKIYAEELVYTFSEWSTDYPSGYPEVFIQSEDRYLWYKEETTDEEYLLREEIGEKEVDYEDFIYSIESDPSITKPEEKEDRIIEELHLTYSDNDITKIRLSKDLRIYEIDLSHREPYEGVKLMNKASYKLLFDGSYSLDYLLEEDATIELDEPINLDNLVFTLYLVATGSSFKVEFLTKDNYVLYSGSFKATTRTMPIKKDELTNNPKEVVYYTYKDKLYKTYNTKKTYTTEYYASKDGYIKDESAKKTFYRYYTNDYVIINFFNSEVVNESYCHKRFCQIVYAPSHENVEPEPEPEPEVTPTPIVNPEPEVVIEPEPLLVEDVPDNPQTIDTIYYDVILLVISILSTIFIYRRKIFLVLSNRFKSLKKFSNMFL